MLKADINKFNVPEDTPIVVRLFINGQYMGAAKVVDNFNYSSPDHHIYIDADFELFEQEKK